MCSSALCALRPLVKNFSNQTVAILSFLSLLLMLACLSELAYLVLEVYFITKVISAANHWEFLIHNVAIGGIIGALALRYFYVQHQWRLKVQAETNTRLKLLQARIRPHFLFNSMNTIASLIRGNPELAEETIHDLSDLFRASLSDAKNLSTLQDELDLARGYLRIEAQRLGERLNVSWDLDELPLDAKMPTLILQPLLENAIYHGIEPSPDKGEIEIVGRYRRYKVNISIRNSQAPALKKRRAEGNHMALENIRQRLEGLYQENAGLTQGEVEGDYQVRLFFPHPWIDET
jgi:two-component system sensor histidine kinase AlgZ